MINENDLRRGNLIYGVSDRVEKVVALREGFITACTPTLEDNAMEFESEYFNPIELTEEWLLKMGFEKHEKYNSFLFQNFIIEQGLGDIFGTGWSFRIALDYDNSQHIRDIKHVHQIQNAIFSLTGEELTIKTMQK